MNNKIYVQTIILKMEWNTIDVYLSDMYVIIEYENTQDSQFKF